jgi:3-phenylpropionate/trans-cinnamate dioxygenase ferredoxin reductase component
VAVRLESVVVVGASIAGLNALQALRRDGFDGSITLVGSEHRLPYDRPPLSKGFLAGREPLAQLSLTSEDKLAELAVELALGERAVSLDLSERTVRLGSGRGVHFDGLVIATGATPRRLSSLAEIDGVLTLRTLEDALDLKTRLAEPGVRLLIVGGGFLGMEVAATARGLGAEVTVVEPLVTPLARVLGREIGDTVAALHRDHGVKLRLETGVEEVFGTSRVEGARLSDGTTLEADVVLVAVGVRPETAWLEQSGLALDDGVLCDATLFASREVAVVAAGDLARFPFALAGQVVRFEHRTSAAELGAHAGASLLAGEQAVPFDLVPYFWSDQYEIKMQSIGVPGPDDDVHVVTGSLAERRFVACFGRGGVLSAVVGFGMPRDLMRLRPLLVRRATLEEALAAAGDA